MFGKKATKLFKKVLKHKFFQNNEERKKDNQLRKKKNDS